MLKFSGFHFPKPLLLSFVSLGLLFFAVDASAQSENEKVEATYPKNTDRVVMEDQQVSHDNAAVRSAPAKTPAIQKNLPSQAKKESTTGEVLIEKEPKKNESPSTLSFNIFLYIVDKFKAD